MLEKDSGRSRGFGFVVFESTSSVESVLRQVEHVIDGKKVECKIAVPKEKKQKASKKKRKNPNMRGRGYSGTSNSSDEEKKAHI